MACAVLGIGMPVFLAWSSPVGALKDVLARWQFWMLEAQFVALAVASLHQWRRVVQAVAAPRRVWAGVAACAALALVLTAAVAPHTSRIYYDEQIYQAIGRSMADERLAQMCNDGIVEYGRLQCRSGEYNKQPYGYPYLLSVAYRIAGAGPAVAHYLNNLAFAALVLVVFLTGSLLFGRRAGLAAALIVALVPMQILWSSTAAAEPTAALMCAVALLSAVHFARTRTTGGLVWCASAVVFASSFRPECVLIVPVAAAVVMVLARGEFVRPRIWWGAAVAGLGGWNVAAHAIAVRHEPWGSAGERMSLDFIPMNLRTNGLFYVWDERFPVVFTALALAGMWAFRRKAGAWLVAAAFFAFWGVFLAFYAGSYDYGADVRYSLMSYAPLAVLAGAGFASLASRLESAVPGRGAGRLATAALLFYWILYLPLVRSVGEEAWGARADVAFVERIVADLPVNSVVLTHTPSTFLVRDVNAVQTSIGATDPNRIPELFDRFGGGVYLHWGFWCNVADPVQQAFCTTVAGKHPHVRVAEQRVRNYRFALYELRRSANTAQPERGPEAGRSETGS